jgi:dTDP-glucose 4,6-dehydratase
MKNVLVTGGAGFIGANFVHYLLGVRPEVNVVTLDLLTYAGFRENLDGLPDPSRHSFVKGDICDGELVTRILREHNIDTIVHFAAESHVDRSIAGPAAFVHTNIEGTFALLEVARTVWQDGGSPEGRTCAFHHVSTDEVFGDLGPSDPAFTESTPYDPSSPYSASKAASDHLVRAYGRTYGIPYTISNCSNNYGPRQLPEKLIPLTIMRALRGESIPIYGDGRQIRDWLYVDDHCTGILAILERGRVGETYNIGGGNQPTNLDIVHTLCGLMDEMVPSKTEGSYRELIAFVTDRPGHDRRYAIDFRKIESELGWTPQESLESGLRKTVRWYLDNGTWMEAVTTRETSRDWIEEHYEQREAQK